MLSLFFLCLTLEPILASYLLFLLNFYSFSSPLSCMFKEKGEETVEGTGLWREIFCYLVKLFFPCSYIQAFIFSLLSSSSQTRLESGSGTGYGHIYALGSGGRLLAAFETRECRDLVVRTLMFMLFHVRRVNHFLSCLLLTVL